MSAFLAAAWLSAHAAKPVEVQGTLGFALQADRGMQRIYGKRSPLLAFGRATVWLAGPFGAGASFGLQLRDGIGVAPGGVEPPSMRIVELPCVVEVSLRPPQSLAVRPVLRVGGGVLIAHEFALGDEPVAPWVSVLPAAAATGELQIGLPFPEATWDGARGGLPGPVDARFVLAGSLRLARAPSGVDLSAASVQAGIAVTLE
jgi:hypothetical protein